MNASVLDRSAWALAASARATASLASASTRHGAFGKDQRVDSRAAATIRPFSARDRRRRRCTDVITSTCVLVIGLILGTDGASARRAGGTAIEDKLVAEKAESLQR
jgi:hypothetical protein